MHHRTRFILPACLVLGASCTWGIPFESTGGSTTGGPVCDEPAGEPGSTIRVVRMHGLKDQSVHDVALDAMGNVYVFGSFQTELYVDGETDLEWTFKASEVMAPFLAKFACDGSLEWVKTGSQDVKGMDETGGARAVAVTGSQDVLVTGGFTGGLHLGAFDLTGAGESSAFLARYTPEGEVAAAVVVKAPAIVGMDVAEDGQDVYVVGKCQPQPGGVSGVLLSKHDPVTLEQVSSNCVTAGVDVETMDYLLQTTARSLALQGDGLVIAGTYVGMLAAPSTCGPSNDTADAFVAKYTLDLQAEQWCTRFGGNGSYEAIDDIVTSGTKSIAVGYSRDGRGSLIDAAGCPDTQGIPPYPAQAEGSIVATLSSSNGTCSAASFYEGVSHRIYGASAAEGSVYVTGQFANKLQNLDNTTPTFFVGQGVDLVWAKQMHSSGAVLATGHRVAAGDRLAVVGSLSKLGAANYEGADGTDINLSSPDGNYDSFLLLLWP